MWMGEPIWQRTDFFFTSVFKTGGYPEFGKFQQKLNALNNQLLMLTMTTKGWKTNRCKWCHKTFQGNRWDKIDCIVMQYSLAYIFFGGRKAKFMSSFKKEIYTRFWKYCICGRYGHVRKKCQWRKHLEEPFQRMSFTLWLSITNSYPGRGLCQVIDHHGPYYHNYLGEE